MHVMLGVEHNRYDLLLLEPQENLEIIALVKEDFGTDHFRLVDLRMALVVLHHADDAVNGSVSNEGRSQPIVDYALWNVSVGLVGWRPCHDLSCAQLLFPLRGSIRPQEVSASNLIAQA